MDENNFIIFQMITIVASNSKYSFISLEMEEGVNQSMNPIVGVHDVFGTMQITLALFKTLTNFTLENFDEIHS
jgi:hypothetical protein